MCVSEGDDSDLTRPREYYDKWKNKFDDNRQRYLQVLKKLTAEGWRVAVIWECATRDAEVFVKVINKLHSWIQSDESQYFESDYRKT